MTSRAKGFQLNSIVMYYLDGTNSAPSRQYIGKIVSITKCWITVQFTNLLYSRKFSLISGYLSGSSKEYERNRPFIRLATHEETELAAKQEAFDIIRVYFQDYNNCKQIPDYQICKIQNIIGKQNQLISM